MKKSIVVLLILTCTFSLLSIPIRSSSGELLQTSAAPQVEIIAHRGFADLAPENTIPAFLNAFSLGAPAVELDVQMTKDNVAVVIHDDSVNRTTNGRGKVNSLTFAELRSLDAGIKFSPKYAGTKIPTLREVLTALKDKGQVYVELKASVKTQDIPGILQTVYATHTENKVLITSFYENSLQKVRQLDRKIPLVVLYANGTINYKNLERIHPQLLSIDYKLLLRNPQIVSEVRRHGMDLSAWTVDNPKDIQRLKAIGVYKILCNRNYSVEGLTT